LLLQAQFDSSIEISPMEEVLGGANSGQLEASANREMSDSQAIAQVLGARAMGHTATLGGDGVIVTAVVGGPNESVFKIDDVIVAVEGSPVDSVSTLHQRLEELGGDREISLQVQRSAGGPVVSVTARTQATVIPSGNQSQSPIAVALLEAPPTVGLGISGRTLNPTAVVDGEIEMNSAGLSGPSGGLAWTLAVIDKLSGGELTDGRRIAVTGTITESGQVGAIGGVMHKLDGAISGGSELFLYPSETGAGEVAALQEKAQGRIKLVAVASLDEALTELGFSPPTTAQNEI
jgi:PDZ domain-containing protein